MKASVYMATSLDGFIARRDGSIDWLDEATALVPEGDDCGFGAFMATVDALVMGRRTYEQVLSFGQWAYGETPVVVLSHRRVAIPSVPRAATASVGSNGGTKERHAESKHNLDRG